MAEFQPGIFTATRNQQEYRLHVKVVKHLKECFPSVLFTHPANRPSSKQHGFFLKEMGVRAGVPDLLLWWESGSGAIELKAPQGVASIGQKTFAFHFKHLGNKHAYCKSVEQVHKTLLGWGIKPKYDCTIFDEPDQRSKADKFHQAYNMYAPYKPHPDGAV